MARRPRKLKLVKEWSETKKIVKKNMADWAKQARKDFRSDPVELVGIRDQQERFKRLNKSFKLGLTPTLKALEAAEEKDDAIRYAKEARFIARQYERLIGRFGDDMGDPRQVSAVLYGMLTRIRKQAGEVIKFWQKNG